ERIAPRLYTIPDLSVQSACYKKLPPRRNSGAPETANSLTEAVCYSATTPAETKMGNGPKHIAYFRFWTHDPSGLFERFRGNFDEWFPFG
ncbi:MAG: hypothetical protein MRY81_15360, partial [Donghicola eburneus]